MPANSSRTTTGGAKRRGSAVETTAAKAALRTIRKKGGHIDFDHEVAIVCLEIACGR
jgi:hypothetical protein